MIRRMEGVSFDTDNATFIARYCEGSKGDPEFVSESLYVQKHRHFLYVEGGECTQYGRTFGEGGIIPVTPQQAKCWYDEHIKPLVICKDGK